ncbi:hypothetical protein Br6_04769 [Rhodococcus sp. Br-6]|nr:hypothetical protein Br6_04769 [Rhodococcus sp. Br-6]
MRIMSIPVFVTAAERLRIIARQATPGPYLRSQAVPGALRCADDSEGERHIAYGVAKEDCRLLVGADPQAYELLAAVLEQAAPTDAGITALAEYATYLGEKMGLKLPAIDLHAAGPSEPSSAPPAPEPGPAAVPATEPTGPAHVDPPVERPAPAPQPAPPAAPAQGAAVFDAADL